MTRTDPEARLLTSSMGWFGPAIAGLFIAIGACTDTIAFKTTIDLVIRTNTELMSLTLAGGATALALLATWNIGVLLRNRARGEQEGAVIRIALLAALWLALCVALFIVRWNGGAFDHSGFSVNAGVTFGGVSGQAQIQPAGSPELEHHLAAVFFSAIYLISGLCTVYEAERLHNPAYFAFRRVSKAYYKQERVAAEAAALATRAQSVVDQCIGEFDLDDERRDAAIEERQAFGAELANYARQLMAQMMGDPAKTNITDTGPVPFRRSAGAPVP
jgi:hypothetical protein